VPEAPARRAIRGGVDVGDEVPERDHAADDR
jgi:hypothetical protein